MRIKVRWRVVSSWVVYTCATQRCGRVARVCVLYRTDFSSICIAVPCTLCTRTKGTKDESTRPAELNTQNPFGRHRAITRAHTHTSYKRVITHTIAYHLYFLLLTRTRTPLVARTTPPPTTISCTYYYIRV